MYPSFSSISWFLLNRIRSWLYHQRTIKIVLPFLECRKNMIWFDCPYWYPFFFITFANLSKSRFRWLFEPIGLCKNHDDGIIMKIYSCNSSFMKTFFMSSWCRGHSKFVAWDRTQIVFNFATGVNVRCNQFHRFV